MIYMVKVSLHFSLITTKLICTWWMGVNCYVKIDFLPKLFHTSFDHFSHLVLLWLLCRQHSCNPYFLCVGCLFGYTLTVRICLSFHFFIFIFFIVDTISCTGWEAMLLLFDSPFFKCIFKWFIYSNNVYDILYVLLTNLYISFHYANTLCKKWQ